MQPLSVINVFVVRLFAKVLRVVSADKVSGDIAFDLIEDLIKLQDVEILIRLLFLFWAIMSP